MYKKSLENDDPKRVPVLPTTSTIQKWSVIQAADLKDGWAIFRPRTKIGFTLAQRTYLQQKYDEGEKGGTKWDAWYSKQKQVHFLLVMHFLVYKIFPRFQHMQTGKRQGQFIFKPS